MDVENIHSYYWLLTIMYSILFMFHEWTHTGVVICDMKASNNVWSLFKYEILDVSVTCWRSCFFIHTSGACERWPRPVYVRHKGSTILLCQRLAHSPITTCSSEVVIMKHIYLKTKKPQPYQTIWRSPDAHWST